MIHKFRLKQAGQFHQLTVSYTGTEAGFAITARASPATNVNDDTFDSTITITIDDVTANFSLCLHIIHNR